MLTQKNNLFFKSSRGKEGNRGLASACPRPPGHLGGTHRGPEQGTPCLGTAGRSWHEGTGPARAGSHHVPATGTACPCPSGSLTCLWAVTVWGGCSVSVWEGDAAPCPVPHSWGREDRNWAERVGLGSGPAEGAAGTGHPHGPHRAGEGQEERTPHGPHKALAGVWEPNPTDPTGPTEPCSWRMHPTRTPYTLHGPFHPTWAHCTPHGPLPPYMGPTHAEWATHTPHGPHTSPMGPTQPTWTPYTPHGLHTPPMGPTQPTRALHTPHGPHTPHMSPTQAPQSPGGFWEPMLHDPTEPWGVHRPHTAPIVVVLGNPPYTGPTAPSGP